MREQDNDDRARRPWVDPEIRELDVRDTSATPNRGDDLGGNPYVDCTRS